MTDSKKPKRQRPPAIDLEKLGPKPRALREGDRFQKRAVEQRAQIDVEWVRDSLGRISRELDAGDVTTARKSHADLVQELDAWLVARRGDQP